MYDIVESFIKMLRFIDEYQRQGSGWVVHDILYLDVSLLKLQSLRGSVHAEIPEQLTSKKATVNIKNNDNKCFLWSVLANIYKADENPNRVSGYIRREGELYIKGIDYPVALNQIVKFERQNVRIAVKVFGYEDNLFPLRISKDQQRPTVIKLLLYDDP